MIRRGVLGIVAVLALAPAALAKPDSPAGKWLTEDRRGVIAIAPCGAGLCGRIVGMADFPADGPLPRDIQGRPECGLEIIHALVPEEPGEWSGTISNPEDGKVYGARLSLDDDGRLRLRGFLRVPIVGAALGSTQVWTQYPGTLTADCRMAPG